MLGDLEIIQEFKTDLGLEIAQEFNTDLQFQSLAL